MQNNREQFEPRGTTTGVDGPVAPTLHERAEAVLNMQAWSKLVGKTPVFLKALGDVEAAAASEATVLISGETGTGKELVARAVHYLGKRTSFPFIPVNCGALPDALLEGELFGHERGAYTDARSRQRGLIHYAEWGTLFLDEVDALTLKAQVSLLRVLQDKRYRALGSGVEQQADVRIVAATNADLAVSVENGKFRADLYYRLRILSINLPPLRERRTDIALLVNHFLKKHSPEGRAVRLRPDALARLMDHHWPGNVRELENAIIRGSQLCKEDLVVPDDLGLPVNTARSARIENVGFTGVPFRAAKRDVIATFEKEYLTRLMSEHAGNVSRAARAAEKERRELGKLLKKHHLNPRDFGSEADPEGFPQA